MELEQWHYKDIEKRREELAKIRHDYNNQLAAITQLIRAGEDSSAQELISQLSRSIAETKENIYSDIPVVNAILSEKAETCASYGIGFSADLAIPRGLCVEQMHLCSIFGNLLDNAINSCRQIKQADASLSPAISLTAATVGDYLFIKAVNPSDAPAKKPKPGRGLGTRILSDYAEKYNGDYTAEYENGVYTAMISLLIAPPPKKRTPFGKRKARMTG